jgi:segregation and condensation protein B
MAKKKSKKQETAELKSNDQAEATHEELSADLEASEDEVIDLSEEEAPEALAAASSSDDSDFEANEVAMEDLEDEGMLAELEADGDDDALSEFKDYDSLEEEYPEDEIYSESAETADSLGILTPKERRLLNMTLEARVEAILFASQKPLKAAEILEILGDEDLKVEYIETTLSDIAEFYNARAGGFRLHYLKRLGFQFQTADSAGAIMEKMFASRPRPISRAALETLAIIAYRQPVTRAEVEFIRGVDAGSIFKTLLERDLIKCTGRKEIVGRPMLFGTSDDFLKVFNLSSIKDLPPLESFQPSREVVQGAMDRIAEGPDDLVDIEQYIADNSGGETLAAEGADDEAEDLEAGAAGEGLEAKSSEASDEDDDNLDLLESVANELHGDRERAPGRTFGATKTPSATNEESEPETLSPAEDIDGTDSDTEMAFSDGDSVPPRSGDLDQ